MSTLKLLLLGFSLFVFSVGSISYEDRNDDYGNDKSRDRSSRDSRGRRGKGKGRDSKEESPTPQPSILSDLTTAPTGSPLVEEITNNPTLVPSTNPTTNPTTESRINDQFDLPVPGENFTVNEERVNGSYVLLNNTKFLDVETIIECNADYTKSNISRAVILANTSFIKLAYEPSTLEIEVGQVLLLNYFIVTNNSYGLPENCTEIPATKVVKIEINQLENYIKFYVIDADFIDYFEELNINVVNGTANNTGPQFNRVFPGDIPQSDIVTNENGTNITEMYENITLTEYEIQCADVDDLGNVISIVNDSNCNGSAITQFGTELGTDGFNSNVMLSRRRLFFRAIARAVKTVVEKVVEVVEVIVQIITGNIDRDWGFGIEVDESSTYEISGVKTRSLGSGGSVTVAGSFSVTAGVYFEFFVGLNLQINYKLFDKNPRFERFRITIGGRTEFNAFLTLALEGSITIEYTFLEADKRFTIWIGPIPIIITVGANFGFGLEVGTRFSYTVNGGYNPISAEFGVQWTPSGGWEAIKELNIELATYFTYGADLNEDGNCVVVDLEAALIVEIFLTFYEILTAAFEITLAAPTSLAWPGSCNDMFEPCDFRPRKLQFNTEVGLEGALIFSIDVEKFGFDPIELVIPLFQFDLFDFETCVNFDIPVLDSLCCPTTASPSRSPSESPSLSPSKFPTISPTETPTRVTNSPTGNTNSPTALTNSPTMTTVSPTASTGSPTSLTLSPTVTTNMPSAAPTFAFNKRCVTVEKIDLNDAYVYFTWSYLEPEISCWDEPGASCNINGNFYIEISDACSSNRTRTITPQFDFDPIVYNETLCLTYQGSICGSVTLELYEEDEPVDSDDGPPNGGFFQIDPTATGRQKVGIFTYTYFQVAN